MKFKYVFIVFLLISLSVIVYYVFKNQGKSIEDKDTGAIVHQQGLRVNENNLTTHNDSTVHVVKGEFIQHQFYSISYSEEHEQPYWVKYTLTRKMLENPVAKRKDNFRSDPMISTGSAELADYKGSGYDRGHLCPAKDMESSITAMSESFYMSNMSPQHPSFNRGRWKQLEDQVRKWTFEYDSVIVYCGGVLDSLDGYIGPNYVGVPKYYYKVIYAPNKTEKAISFVMPNKKCEHNLKYYTVSVDSVEKFTHIDFFSEFPVDFQQEFESSISFSSWF